MVNDGLRPRNRARATWRTEMTCMCGGCDTCMKDQGVLTEAQERAEAVIYMQARENLGDEFDATPREKLAEAIGDAMATDLGVKEETKALDMMRVKNFPAALDAMAECLAAVREHYISERIEDEIKRVRHEMSR